MSSGGDGPRGGGGRTGAVRAWLVWWALLVGLYLALADSRRLEEVVAGLVVGALGATAALLVRQQRELLMRPHTRWIASELRTLLSWPRDLVLLAGALVHRPHGEVIEQPFEATRDDPGDAAQRALAVAGRSLAPNTIVLGIDAERGVLHAHKLVEDGQ